MYLIPLRQMLEAERFKLCHHRVRRFSARLSLSSFRFPDRSRFVGAVEGRWSRRNDADSELYFCVSALVTRWLFWRLVWEAFGKVNERLDVRRLLAFCLVEMEGYGGVDEGRSRR